jgi:hypothetical protein
VRKRGAEGLGGLGKMGKMGKLGKMGKQCRDVACYVWELGEHYLSKKIPLT